MLFLNGFLESTFVETSDSIIGCIYKHPQMPINDFNSFYLKNVLNKLRKENKKNFLMGDFNIDLLNSTKDNNIDMFLDEMYSLFLQPQINLPTRITSFSKTLIDNIFANNHFY